MPISFRALKAAIATVVLTATAPAAEVVFQALRDSKGVQFWMMTPNKEYVLYYEDGGTIRKVEIAHPENNVVLLDSRENYLYRPSAAYITPDGQYLAASGYTIRLDKSVPPRRLYALDSNYFVPFPNSDRYILMVYTSGKYYLYAQDVRGQSDIRQITAFESANVPNLAISADGRYIYYRDSNKSLFRSYVYEMRQAETLKTGVEDFKLSKDGQFLAYTVRTGGNYDLWLRDTRSGTDHSVSSAPRNLLYNFFDFSPDSKSFSVTTAQGISEFSVETPNTPRQEVNISDATRPSYSPDGHTVFFHQYENSIRFGAWDLTGERALRLNDTIYYQNTRTPIVSPDGKWAIELDYYSGGLVAYDLQTEELTDTRIELPIGQYDPTPPHWWADDSSKFYWLSSNKLREFDLKRKRSSLVLGNLSRLSGYSPSVVELDSKVRLAIFTNGAGDYNDLFSIDLIDGDIVKLSLTDPPRGGLSILGTTDQSKILYFYSDGTQNLGAYSYSGYGLNLVSGLSRFDHARFVPKSDVALLYSYYSTSILRSYAGENVDPEIATHDLYSDMFWMPKSESRIYQSRFITEEHCTEDCPDRDGDCPPPTCNTYYYGTSFSETGFDAPSLNLGFIDFWSGKDFRVGPDDRSAIYAAAVRGFSFNTSDDATCVLYPGELTVRRGTYLGMTKDRQNLLLARIDLTCKTPECTYAVVKSSTADAREEIVYGPERTQSLIQAVYSEEAGVALVANKNELLRVPLDPPGPAEAVFPDNAHELLTSPDGRTGVFVHYPPNNAPHELYALNLTGPPNVRRCDPALATTYKLNTPIFTPDGNYLLYTAYKNYDMRSPVSLFSVSLRDFRPPVPLVLDDLSGRYLDYDVSVSPDSKLVAIWMSVPNFGAKMFIAGVGGGSVAEVTAPEQFCNSKGWWTYDGLYFTGSDYRWSTDQLLHVPYDSRGTGEGEGEGIPEGQSEGEGQPPTHYASADVNRDHRIDLSEALRVVQLYNAGAYHCEGDTEDTFAPGAGDTACTPHTSDYAPQDWRIGLAEVLRAAQLYNARSYTPCLDGEDGFCPIY